MGNNTDYKIAIKFGKASRTYDHYADVHRQVATYLIRHSPWPKEDEIALDLGAGTGIVTKLVSKRHSSKALLALDISIQMLDVLRENNPGISCVQADLNNSLPFQACSFSYIYSSMALQWVKFSEQIVSILSNNIKLGGNFAIAVVLNNTFSKLHKTRSSIESFNPPKLPDYKELCAYFSDSQLLLKNHECHTFTDSFSDIDELFNSIRGLGISGNSETPLSRDKFLELKKRLIDSFCEENRDPYLNYEIGFFWGEKK
ncbi:MAG TPA: methyltransferase domain-containing protein [Oligoflexia bacterium]|nr:methyltransferase domain-containing protein [Oligoflexia bacterium]HMP47824.1 methyltransferase domain-containing protein [Oligoflexia bacterium]